MLTFLKRYNSELKKVNKELSNMKNRDAGTIVKSFEETLSIFQPPLLAFCSGHLIDDMNIELNAIIGKKLDLIHRDRDLKFKGIRIISLMTEDIIKEYNFTEDFLRSIVEKARAIGKERWCFFIYPNEISYYVDL